MGKRSKRQGERSSHHSAESRFGGLLRERTIAQADLLGAVTAHPTLLGMGRERALSDLLRELVPRRYEVLTGTVLPQDPSGNPSPEDRQIDVMIVDTLDYPTVLRAGDIAIALPQAVRVIVEVKSGLRSPKTKKGEVKGGETFLTAMEQIGELQMLLDPYGPAFTALLSYGAPTKNKTLRRWLEDVLDVRKARWQPFTSEANQPSKSNRAFARLSAVNMPSLIVADEGAIAMKTVYGDASDPCYEFFRPKHDKNAILAMGRQIVLHLGVEVAKATLSNQRNEAFHFMGKVLASIEPDSSCERLIIADPQPGS